MDEYIDRKVAFDTITELAGKAPTRSAYEAVWKSARVLKKIPSANVVPVVYGRWEQDTDGDWYCTNCGEVVAICDSDKNRTYRKPYCPNCGAQMKEQDGFCDAGDRSEEINNG